MLNVMVSCKRIEGSQSGLPSAQKNGDPQVDVLRSMFCPIVERPNQKF